MVKRIHNKVTPELDVVRHIHRDCKDCKFESHKGAETELRLDFTLFYPPSISMYQHRFWITSAKTLPLYTLPFRKCYL